MSAHATATRPISDAMGVTLLWSTHRTPGAGDVSIPNDNPLLMGVGALQFQIGGLPRPSMWHPALPEVRPAQSDDWSGIWILTGEAKRTGGLVWRGAMAALFLSLLLPLAAQAQEPCRVNVVTCTAAECAYLPGVGPAKGAAIEAAHPADEAALDAVPGIGAATLAKIRPHVVYQGPTTCTSKQVAPKPEAPKGGEDPQD